MRDTAPRVWLVAHYDTKGQRLSMAGRLVAVGLVLAGAAGVIKLGIAAAVGIRVGPAAWWIAAALAAAGGLALALLGLRNDSPGALDNGTGVRAVLTAAEALRKDAGVGVILPDAEELGLVGARALARERPELFHDAAVINLDGLDDQGPVFALVHRPGPVTDAACAALGARRWRWLPVLVDGIPLGRVAREAVTILRGNLATMRIVHTPRDTAERLTYAGADGIAASMVHTLKRVLGAAPR